MKDLKFNTPTNINNFRFWCQKVLPLVYDDSLSYYELLCKVVESLNKVINNTNIITDNMQELYNFINNYFKNLDVQKEINTKLDEMAKNGELDNILSHYMNGYLNVLFLGVKNDGTTNNTSVIQNILNSHPTGVNLYFPEGVYVFNNIDVLYKCTITGAGIGKTIFKTPINSPDPMFIIKENYGIVHFERFSADGNVAEYGATFLKINENNTSQGSSKMYIDNTTTPSEPLQTKMCVIEDIYISHFYTGFDFKAYSFHVIMRNVYTFTCFVGMKNDTTDNFFTDLYFDNCQYEGIIDDGSSNKWTNIKVIWCGKQKRNGYAVYLTGYKNHFTNIETQDNYCSGFYIGGSTSVFSNCVSDRDGVPVSDTTDTPTIYGFFITGSSNILDIAVRSYSGQHYYNKCVQNSNRNNTNIINAYYDHTLESDYSNVLKLEQKISENIYVPSNANNIIITFEKLPGDYVNQFVGGFLLEGVFNNKLLHCVGEIIIYQTDKLNVVNTGTLEKTPVLTRDNNYLTLTISATDLTGRYLHIETFGFTNYNIYTN